MKPFQDTRATPALRVECPNCGTRAKRVSAITLGALLKDGFARQSNQSGPTYGSSSVNGCQTTAEDTGWRFCDSVDCDVLYFSETDESVFTKSQLKVRVGVKETAGDRPLCFCFGHSVASIKGELESTGRSDVLADIRAKMKNPGCRCETENPSGSCCLGNVAKGIVTAQKELKMSNTIIDPEIATSTLAANRGELIAKVGTVISAMMASACCWLPLVLLAVGVSGAGIASTLEAYRPLFITVTIGFLIAVFYFTYRPKKATGGGSHACCAPEVPAAEASTGKACCVPATKGKVSLMAMNKVMLWGVTILATAFLFFPSYIGTLLGTGDANAVTGDMTRSVIKVEGMTCEGCSVTVAKAIRSVTGVQAVSVKYDNGEAIVGTESCCTVPKDEILSALQDAGHNGTFIKSNE